MGDLNQTAEPDPGPTASAGPTTPAGSLDALAAEVAELRDLFRRRLLDDKDRRRLYDELYQQLQWAREGLEQQTLAPLLRELCLVIDRIDPETAGELARSVRDELLEIVARRGVTPIEAAAEPFDPSRHEAVDTVPAAPGAPPGQVAAIVRPGYRHGERVLRPAQVVVTR